MLKKISAILLCVLMVLAVLPGCTKSSTPAATTPQGTGDQASSPATTTDAGKSAWIADQEFTVTLMRPETSNQPFPKDNPILAEIKKRLGVNVDLQLVTSDYEAKCAALIGSDDMPDVMVVARAETAVAFAGSGSFLCVSDYYNVMPNYQDRMKLDVNYQRVGTAEGKFYYLIPSSVFVYTGATAPAIREDILKETGLPIPTTYEELNTVLHKIKDLYPNDFPWSSRWSYQKLFQDCAYAMGTGFEMYYDPDIDGGKWVYGTVRPEFKDAVAYFAQLYKDGILDPDFAVNESSAYKEKYASGRSTFFFGNGTFLMNFNSTLASSIGPDAKFVPMNLLKTKTGVQRQQAWSQYNKDDGIIISKNVKNPENVMKFLDWFYSEDGITLTNWGIEGQTYQVNASGDKEVIPAVADQFRSAPDPWRAFMASWGFGQLGLAMTYDERTQAPYLDDASKAFYDFWAADKNYDDMLIDPPFTEAELEEINQIRSTINPIIDPAIEGMITGAVSLDTFETTAAQVKAAGADRLEELYNAAEARMKSNS
jgi:putative aldouronate transport system substrate-binding protein